MATGGQGATISGKYLSLETYRRNGTGVRTPVWFARGEANTLFVYTTGDSGKAKRIRREPNVKIATCDVRGAVTGGWIAARAEIVEGAAFVTGMKSLNRKYWPWKQMLDIATRLVPRHQRIMLAIRPS